MARSKQTDDVKVTTGEGKITLTIGADTVKLGSNPSEHKLPSQRLEHTLSKLQDALGALKLAAEELRIVDAEMIGSDAHRRLIVESSAAKPIETADDITSHRTQSAEIAQFAADVGKLAKQVKGKAAFIGQALGSVYNSELLEGDRAREKAKDKQAKLFKARKEPTR
jgi:hypothetical protein